MNVAQIIDDVISFWIGTDQATEENQNLSLRYFNIACREIYKETAILNNDLRIIENFAVQPTSDPLELSNSVFAIKCVNDSLNPNIRYHWTNFDKFHIMKINSSITYGGFYTTQKNKVYILNRDYSTITPFVIYVPNFNNLSLNSQEEDIPIPAAFHNLLIVGTLYFSYRDMDGLKSSINYNNLIVDWNKGVSQLKAYLSNKLDDNVILNDQYI